MKKRALALALSACLLLTGCEAMLERSYETAAPHEEKPTTAGDPSVLRVENYRELVSAVLYLVSQGAEEGTIQLHGYAGDAEADLTAACLEVANQDPLGAYAVDYIKHEVARVLTDYQAALTIGYRRTMEQVRSMVNVTGSGAIRSEVQKALADFQSEVVLRVAYFAEDEGSIAALIRQAYYDAPITALGMPEYTIRLYPDEGRERVVEIFLTYPESADALREKSKALELAAVSLANDGEALYSAGIETPEERARRRASLLWSACTYDPEGGPTAYDALVEGRADSEGMALAYSLLCRRAGVDCEIVEGVWKTAVTGEDGETAETVVEEPRFWNAVTLGRETFYLDCAMQEFGPYTAQALFDFGYRWPGGPAEPEPEETPEEGGERADGDGETAVEVPETALQEAGGETTP